MSSLRLRERAEELGYVHLSCRLCGWHGWTDTGVCEGCVFCRECGKPVINEKPCECEEEEQS